MPSTEDVARFWNNMTAMERLDFCYTNNFKYSEVLRCFTNNFNEIEPELQEKIYNAVMQIKIDVERKIGES